MRESKLGLDYKKVEGARAMAGEIAAQVQQFVENYTTVAVERTLCRLVGIDGTDIDGIPLPNLVVEAVSQKGMLGNGVLRFLGVAVNSTGKSPVQIASEIAGEVFDFSSLEINKPENIAEALRPYIEESVSRIRAKRLAREESIKKYGEGSRPLLYVIVATGNIYEDAIQAQAAARQGADVVAVIRTTGQSLLDYVPYGATTEGFGGTYATQENFRIMRKALDQIMPETGRYVRLCNYCSGLCMPEIAVMGALEGLDVMLNDALYGILFRDINMQDPGRPVFFQDN
jgi:beta-lysine 5,6-aminomutase alpha subunit